MGLEDLLTVISVASGLTLFWEYFCSEVKELLRQLETQSVDDDLYRHRLGPAPDELLLSSKELRRSLMCD